MNVHNPFLSIKNSSCFIVLMILFSTYFKCQAQVQTGSFKGVLFQKNTDPINGMYYSFDLPSENENILLRAESSNGKNAVIKKANFKYLSTTEIEILESIITQKSKTNTLSWCKYKINIQFDEQSGYWTGTYNSTDCANQRGDVVFYRTDEQWSKDINLLNSVSTTSKNIQGFKDGLPAPDKIELNRKNFKFTPVYFDFDQAILKEEYNEYLTKMGQMVKGHSDIRIRVIGHTDAIGSDHYNDGLSLRRTKAIASFFNANGIPTNRLVFDFKGEKFPIATNESAEGRQLNRRVDFEFIYE